MSTEIKKKGKTAGYSNEVRNARRAEAEHWAALDPTTQICLLAKRQNQIKNMRMKHIRFFRLAVGERFDINLVPYKKAGIFSARHATTGALRRILPWDFVRSGRPVKPLPSPIVVVPPAHSAMGCQGDGDASGDRKSETIGGNEPCQSA